MAAKDKSFFANIADDVVTRTPQRTRTTPGYLANRDDTLGDLANGKYESRSLLWVDPDECRVWEHHNRRYDLLDERRCADLIEGIRSMGRQEFAAVARPVSDDSGCKYEVIAGARRHWTITWLRANNYPNFKFLIDVRARLTDEEAFRISDIENRDRDDISDYERAVDYKRALDLYYKLQKDMAQRLEVSEGWLSRYLDLAALPETLVWAYGDIRDIRVQHARDLKPHLKSKSGKQATITAAKEIAQEQKARLNNEQAPLDGNEVLHRLKIAGKTTKPRKASTTIELDPKLGADGRVLIRGKYNPRQGWTVRIPKNSAETREELINALNELLDSTG